MENNEFKNACIKNSMCYYFDDLAKFKDFHFNNILINEKSHENIQIYNISYKTLIGAKELHNRLNKIDGFIRIHNRNTYLVLFGLEKYDAIYNRIRYLISQTAVSHSFFSLLSKNQSRFF